MEFILNNIFVLLPIAIFIGLRIVEARRKYQNSQHTPQKSPRVFDDEEESAGPGSVPWRDAYTPPPPVRAAKPVIRNVPDMAPAIAMPLHVQTGGEELPTAAVKQTARLQTISPGQPQEKDFSMNLKHLPPLQRAVAMSEILGPPKGM